MNMPPGAAIEIHVVADSTGDTAARVARAAQAQYQDHEVRIVRHPRISSADALRSVVGRIRADADGSGTPHVAVFSTLVDEDLRVLLADQCQELRLPHADLLDSALTALQQATGEAPQRVVRPVGIDEDYFTRIQAMEFAIANDDGNLNNRLDDADVVLVGVSRTGKTPLSMYLGYLGFKTANIPLVPGISPPEELFRTDRWKVVGLTIDPERLQSIRKRRVTAMGSRGASGKDGYADLGRIHDELDEVGAIQRRLGCPLIDTTALALEEAAGRIIETIDKRRRALTGA